MLTFSRIVYFVISYISPPIRENDYLKAIFDRVILVVEESRLMLALRHTVWKNKKITLTENFFMKLAQL